MTPSAALLTLSEQSSLFFFSYDVTARRFVYLNPAFQDFWGLSGSTAEYSALLSIVHPDDRQYFESKINDCQNGKAVHEVECRIVRGNQDRWLRTSFYLSEDNGNPWLIGHGENITVYKEHSDNLNKHNNKKILF